MGNHHTRDHFPLPSWHLYLQGALGVALGRLLAVAERLAVARSALQKGARSYEEVKAFESFNWSYILQCYAVLELIANGLVRTALYLNDTRRWKPLTPRGLTKAQWDRLQGRISTVEKLELAPALFGTLYHRQPRVEWKDLGWQAICQLRRVRNKLVHVRLADANRLEARFKAERRGQTGLRLLNLAEIVAPEMHIPDNAAWDALAGLGWYLLIVDRMPGFGRNTRWRTNWVFRRNALLRMSQALDQIWGMPRTKMRAYACSLLSSWRS